MDEDEERIEREVADIFDGDGMLIFEHIVLSCRDIVTTLEHLHPDPDSPEYGLMVGLRTAVERYDECSSASR